MKTPREIVRKLDQSIVGQGRAKRVLAAAAHQHLTRSLSGGAPSCRKRNVLLLGPTGCGKTFIVSEIARIIDVPSVIVDATRLVPAGIVGDTVESMISRLLDAAGGSVARAERGLVFIDELDKQMSTASIQDALLTVIEGTRVSVVSGGRRTTLDTSRVMFVASGAFTDLRESRRARGGIGFGAIGDKGPALSTDALIEGGVRAELLGRFDAIVELDELGPDQLLSILNGGDGSPASELKEYYRQNGVTLDFTPAALKEVALRAHSLALGARPLRRILLEAMDRFPAADLAREGVSHIRVTEDVIRDERPPEVVTKQDGSVENDIDALEDRARRREAEYDHFPRRPPRWAHAGASAGRLARRSDLGGIWSKRPSGRTAEIPGIRPLVEKSQDGSELELMPKGSLVLSDAVRRGNLFVSGAESVERLVAPLVDADLARRGTLIVCDATDRLARYVAARTRSRRGPRARVIYLDFTDPERSRRWNPLGDVDSAVEAKRVAVCLSGPGSDRFHSSFFDASARRVLESLILAARQKDGGAATGRQILELIESGAIGLVRFLREAGRTGVEEYIADTSSPNAQTTLATLANWLSNWSDERLWATTATTDIDLAQALRRPTVVVVRVAPIERSVAQPLVRCFLDAVHRAILQAPPRHPVSLFVDDVVGATGYMPELRRLLSRDDVHATVGVENLGELETRWRSDGRELLDACATHAVLTPCARAEARHASDRSGQTVVDEITVRSGAVPDSSRPRMRPTFEEFEVLTFPTHPRYGPLGVFTFAEQPPLLAYTSPVSVDVSFQFRRRAAASAVADVRAKRRLRRRLEELRSDSLGWADASIHARLWWTELERSQSLSEMVELAESLVSRNTTLGSFHNLFLRTCTRDVAANLHYLDYLSAKREAPAQEVSPLFEDFFQE